MIPENGNDCTNEVDPASSASPSPWEPLACLLEQPDEFLSRELPWWVKTNTVGPHDGLFWLPSVRERVTAMSDGYLTSLLLTLAEPEYLGLNLLFDERLLPRFAAMRESHLHGTFLPAARRIPGFKESWQRWERGVNECRQAQGRHAILIKGTELQEEAIDWLWEPYIAKKTITILDGDPGVGKTMLACQLAASVSRGYPLPDQVGHMTQGSDEPGAVLMVGMEDHLGSVVRKRLLLCQADMSKLTFCNDIVDADGLPRPFTLADLDLLEDYMEQSQPVLVYIDAIQSVLGGKVEIGSPNQIKALLMPLERLAQDYNCAIVCSRHPSKPGQNVARLIHRGMGSQSFIGSARSGLFVEEDPGDKTRSMLFQYKSNMGGRGRTQLFSKAQGLFHWCGVSRIDESVLAGAGRGPNPYALLEACFWLERELEGGISRPTSELEDAAKADEIADGVLNRAKKVLGVQSTQSSGTVHGGWFWYLPPLTLVTADSEPTETTELTEPTAHSDHGSMPYDASEATDDTTAAAGRPLEETPEASEFSVVSEDTEGSVTSEGPIEDAAMVKPCIDCGHTVRWNDNGIPRCVRCWPKSKFEGGHVQ